MSNKLHITQDQFESTIKSGVVVVDFYADWCGPCKMLSPTIEELAEYYDGKATIVKLNVDEAQDVAAQYGVMSIPTVIVFNNANEENRLVGFNAIDDYKEIIDNYIEQ